MTGRGDFIIVYDTREQRPFQFPGAIRKTLASGDYSVAGHEHAIAVERKRVHELFQCAGRERGRFTRELERLSEYEYAALVIEGNLEDVLAPSPYSRVNPKTVVNSLISWSVRFGIHIFFAGSRRLARGLTFNILRMYLEQRRARDARAD